MSADGEKNLENHAQSTTEGDEVKRRTLTVVSEFVVGGWHGAEPSAPAIVLGGPGRTAGVRHDPPGEDTTTLAITKPRVRAANTDQPTC